MTAPDLPTDALASALPAGISHGPTYWESAEIARYQAERLAEAGYVLVHTAPDEATVERLAEAVHDTYCPCGLPNRQTVNDEKDAKAVLAALAGTSAPRRQAVCDE